MKKIIFVVILFSSVRNGVAQNIGIGTTSPNSKLDINGDIALRSATINIAGTYTYALDVNSIKQANYKLTDNTAVGNFIIAGITTGSDGRQITLFNRTGSSMQLYDEDATAIAANRIKTGIGTTLSVYNGGSVTLRYDTAASRWEVISSHYNSLDYFGGGGGSGNWDATGADIYNNNSGKVGIGISNPTAKLTINGNLALLSDTVKVACDIMPAKMLIDNIAKPKSVFHIINDGCGIYMPPMIVGLSGGTDGKMVTIITHLNNTLIQHLQSTAVIPSGADSLNMIELYEPNSNGNINQPSSFNFNAGGSVTLIYDGIRNRWKLLSYNGEIKSETFGWYKGSNANDIYNPNAGNVGIGTGIPVEKLDVNGNIKTRKNLLITDTLVIGAIVPSQKLDVAGSAKIRNDFFVDGSIGIGTATPANKLQVIDANGISGTVKIGAGVANAGYPKLVLFGDGAFVSVGEGAVDDKMELTAGQFYFKTNGGSGNVGIGIAAPAASLSVTRGTGNDGTVAFFGTTNASHFNYSTNEDTYIRGGKSSSKLILNDYGGQVTLGTGNAGNAQLNIVSSRTGTNANGLSINQNTSNGTNNSYGLYSYANGSAQTNFGLSAEAGPTANTNIAGDFKADGTTTGTNKGIYSHATGSTASNTAGHFFAQNIAGTETIGVRAVASGDNSFNYPNMQTGLFAKGINCYAGTFDGLVTMNSNLYVSSGTVYCIAVSESSDEKLKTNIQPIHSSIEKIKMIRPVTYNWKNQQQGQAMQSGFIAQELQKIYPGLVNENRETKKLAIRYTGLVPYLVKAIQEQQQDIETLKAEITELRKIITNK